MEDVKVNSMADGLFQLMDYGLTIAGITLLWRTHQQTTLPKSDITFLASGALLIVIGSVLIDQWKTAEKSITWLSFYRVS